MRAPRYYRYKSCPSRRFRTLQFNNLTLVRRRHFPILPSGGGGAGTTPSAVSKRVVVELSGKIGYCSRRELAIAHISFDHWSIFDLVLGDHRSYFGGIFKLCAPVASSYFLMNLEHFDVSSVTFYPITSGAERPEACGARPRLGDRKCRLTVEVGNVF